MYFPGIARMNTERCTCLFVCFCCLLASMVTAASDVDKQEAALKCWRIGKTTFKLCVDDYENMSSHTSPSLELQLRKKFFDNDFPSSRPFSPPTSYNKGMLTDYGGMVVPFFMKRRWNRHSDLPFQSSFPSKMADNTKGSSIVNKRPFDSISYNAGLGGF